MKMNIKHEEKINAELAKVQAKCKERTIEIQDIKDVITKVEARLNTLGVTKKSRVGIKVEANVFMQHFPNCYKYAAMGTRFKLEYFPSGWFVVDIDRWHCKGNSEKSIKIEYTENAKIEILDNLKYMGV